MVFLLLNAEPSFRYTHGKLNFFRKVWFSLSQIFYGFHRSFQHSSNGLSRAGAKTEEHFFGILITTSVIWSFTDCVLYHIITSLLEVTLNYSWVKKGLFCTFLLIHLALPSFSFLGHPDLRRYRTVCLVFFYSLLIFPAVIEDRSTSLDTICYPSPFL